MTTSEPSLNWRGPKPLVRERLASPAEAEALPGRTPRSLLLLAPKLALRHTGLLLTVLLVGLVLITFPREPLTNNLDSSWAGILGYAREKGLQFGTDIVFTYGPLGFLITPYFGPYDAGLRWVTDVVIGFGLAAAVCLWLWRLDIRWRVLGILLFVVLVSNIRYGVQDLLIQLGFLALGLFCFIETRPRLLVYALGLTGLAVFSGLAKFTFLVTAVITVSAVAVDLLLRNKPRLCLVVVGGFVMGFLAGWTVLGQNLGHLPAFIALGWRVSCAYQQTMGLDPPAPVFWGGVLSAVFALAMIVTRTRSAFGAEERYRGYRRWLLPAWLGLFLFIVWKHGFVRADSHHLLFFLGFTPLLTLFLEAVPGGGRRARVCGRFLCGATCLVSILTIQTMLYPEYLHLENAFTRVIQNTRDLIEPGSRHREMSHALAVEGYRARLPKLSQTIGGATVDVFGSIQSYALFNSFNYRPRPALQSYAASSDFLMRLNEKYYCSSAAPEYVLLGLAPIDRRFPPLEDAMVLRDLLFNYDLKDVEGPFLLLQAKPFAAPRLTLLAERMVEPGQAVDIASFGGEYIWLQVFLEPTIAGGLRQFVYKPGEVNLVVWKGDPFRRVKDKYCSPAPMLAAGFLASPMLTDRAQIQALYLGQPVERPRACSIEFGPGGSHWWKKTIRFRVYRVENAPGGRVRDSGEARNAGS